MFIDTGVVSVAAFSAPTERYIMTFAANSGVQLNHPRIGWNHIYDFIENMIILADDWDGQDSVAPSSEMISGASEFAKALHLEGWTSPTRVAPSPAGTIIFEWQSRDGYYTVEILSPRVAEWILVDKDGNMTHGELDRS